MHRCFAGGAPSLVTAPGAARPVPVRSLPNLSALPQRPDVEGTRPAHGSRRAAPGRGSARARPARLGADCAPRRGRAAGGCWPDADGRSRVRGRRPGLDRTGSTGRTVRRARGRGSRTSVRPETPAWSTAGGHRRGAGPARTGGGCASRHACAQRRTCPEAVECRCPTRRTTAHRDHVPPPPPCRKPHRCPDTVPGGQLSTLPPPPAAPTVRLGAYGSRGCCGACRRPVADRRAVRVGPQARLARQSAVRGLERRRVPASGSAADPLRRRQRPDRSAARRRRGLGDVSQDGRTARWRVWPGGSRSEPRSPRRRQPGRQLLRGGGGRSG